MSTFRIAAAAMHFAPSIGKKKQKQKKGVQEERTAAVTNIVGCGHGESKENIMFGST